MSELISGKEALIALANGQEVECRAYGNNWVNADNKQHPLGLFFDDCFQFRLKQRTITINGIEVPAPFEPKEGEMCWIISDDYIGGYTSTDIVSTSIAVWRSEDEIKKVVTALRTIFKTN